MKCLIIAAGRGHRLQSKGDSKPLTPLFDIPLIERVIRCALEAGADDFFVVTGYKGEGVRVFLDRLTERLGIGITPIVNEDWEKENGLSVLKARDYLREPFLLLMADHLFDPSIVRKLIEFPLTDGEIALGVDGNRSNPLVDLENAAQEKSRITAKREQTGSQYRKQKRIQGYLIWGDGIIYQSAGNSYGQRPV